jgi:hypothetical protein
MSTILLVYWGRDAEWDAEASGLDRSISEPRSIARRRLTSIPSQAILRRLHEVGRRCRSNILPSAYEASPARASRPRHSTLVQIDSSSIVDVEYGAHLLPALHARDRRRQ